MLSTLTMSTEETPSSGVELEKLLLVIQTGLRVRLRHHFFNWTQGPVQTLLPHDLLICAVDDGNAQGYRVESFSCYPQPPSRVEALTRRDGSITLRMAQTWKKNGCDPLLHDAQLAAGSIAALASEIAAHQLGNMVAHGICGGNGGASTFFGFCCMRVPIRPQHTFIAELLVPYLHAAWMRVQQQENTLLERPLATQTVSPAQSAAARLLTARELEVLHWVSEGKSNMEIGLILGISGLTVKNHVQNILRKLKVHNRTQAVSKCMSLNLLQGNTRE